jgi:hypothetical protein
MVLLYLIGAMAAAIAIASGAFYFNDGRRMTSITQGRVLRSEERAIERFGAREMETEIVVSYQAAGRELEMTRLLRGAFGRRYAPGASINVRYNPAEPEMADVA